MSPLSTSSKYRQTTNKKLIRLIAIVLMIMTVLSSMGALQSNAAANFNISNSTLSTTDVAADSKIVMNIKVNGTGTVNQYAYWYRKESESAWYALTSSNWVSSNNFIMYPSRYSRIMSDTNSRWIIRLAAKDTTGAESSKTFYVTVGQPKISIDTFTAPDLTLGQSINLKTTLSDTVSGFTYQYKYTYVDKDGTERLITDFQNKANYTWSTANNNTLPENANCTLKVYVREKNGKAKQATKTTTIKVTKPTYPDVNISSFSASKSGYVGDSVTLKASVSSGTAPYEYQYSYDDNKGTKHIITAYTAGKTSTTWNTSSLSAGDYTIRVEVRDKNKKTATKTSTISLKTRNVKGSISTMETSYTQNDEWYPNVRFQVNISDETTAPSPYKYKVQYKKSSDKNYTNLSDFKTYSGSTQIELLPTSKDIGTYNYRLIVRDKNNKEYTINATSTFEIKYNALKFNFNASTKEFLTGGGDQKSTFTVSDVTGGNGKDIQYKFEYTKYADLTTASPKLDSNNATWTTLKDWSEESTSELIVDKQEDSGYYAVRVSVQNKDNTDSSKISTKTIDKIKVKKPIEVSLTDINDLITKVDTWMNNSLTDTQRNILKDWENDPKDEGTLSIYDYHYSTFQVAYDTAKDAPNHDKSEYSKIYKNLDDEFTKLKTFFKSDEFRSYSPNDDGSTDWSSPGAICSFIFKTFTNYLVMVIDCFSMLAGNGKTSVSFFAGFDYNQIAQAIYPVFQAIAYALIVILIGVNAIESAFQYEMFTLRGGFKIAVRLIFAKIFVDLSLTICQSIISIGVGWTNQILELTKGILNDLQLTLTSPEGSGLWIVGWIVDFFTGILFLVIIGPVAIALAIAAFCVMCKLFIRCFEIAMLQCVSPAFFACLCGETTKEYFKRFMISYISVVLDVVFTAVVFYIYAQYLNGFITNIDIQNMDEVLSMQSGFFSFMFVSFGAFILMIKTPRVLKNLVA
jgi:hypothetical protein